VSGTEPRLLVALNGSPVRGGSVDLLLQAVEAGAREAGGRTVHFRCNELNVRPCQSCGPEPTTGYCIFHDDMDPIYEALRDAHAVVVGSPVWFDTVSAQLKLVIDRCNCLTMLVRTPGGDAFRPQWPRTRRAAFVTACAAGQRHDLAERTVRGFLKWVGAKWEETIVHAHPDNDAGSVAGDPEKLAAARTLGRRLIESPPLEG
jgi:multimeric flavodoxin WrbA